MWEEAPLRYFAQSPAKCSAGPDREKFTIAFIRKKQFYKVPFQSKPLREFDKMIAAL